MTAIQIPAQNSFAALNENIERAYIYEQTITAVEITKLAVFCCGINRGVQYALKTAQTTHSQIENVQKKKWSVCRV